MKVWSLTSKIVALSTITLAGAGCQDNQSPAPQPETIILPAPTDSEEATQSYSGKSGIEILNKASTLNPGASQRFNFAAQGVAANDIRFECSLDGQAYSRCPGGNYYEFNNLAAGQTGSLYVRGISKGVIIDEDYVNFKVEGTQVVATPIQAPSLNLLGKYTVHPLPDMVLSQFSTTQTSNLSIYTLNLAEGQVPSYLSPTTIKRDDGCHFYTNAHRSIDDFTYCESSISYDTFFDLFDKRYALNHIELHSPGYSENRPDSQLLVQVFDNKYEFRGTRSRLIDLRKGALNNGSTFKNEVLFTGYWFDEKVRGKMTVFSVFLNGTYWKVGGFIRTEEGFFSDWTCTRCKSFANAIEVVYMEKVTGANFDDALFAQRLQKVMVDALQITNPRIDFGAPVYEDARVHAEPVE